MKVKFNGSMGEDLVVRMVKDGKHHHLEIYHDGKLLWYAHLMKDAISLWELTGAKVKQEGDNIRIELCAK